MTTHHHADHHEKKAARTKHKPSSVFAVRCQTLAAPGPIMVSGVDVGDMLLGVFVDGGTYISAGNADLEHAVTVADQVQQTGSNGPYGAVLVFVRVPDGD